MKFVSWVKLTRSQMEDALVTTKDDATLDLELAGSIDL
jgi:hypothetical protein